MNLGAQENKRSPSKEFSPLNFHISFLTYRKKVRIQTTPSPCNQAVKEANDSNRRVSLLPIVRLRDCASFDPVLLRLWIGSTALNLYTPSRVKRQSAREISKLDLKNLENWNDKATYFRAHYDSTRVTSMEASVQNWNRMWISSIVAMELLVFISTLQGSKTL